MSVARRSLWAGVILACIGGALAAAGWLLAGPAYRPIFVVAGILVLGGAVIVMFRPAARTDGRDATRKLRAYACPQCGYMPTMRNLEGDQPFPCPSCGKPMYEDK